MPPALPKPTRPLGFREFVAITALMMTMNALSIDPMLPALPAIGAALDVAYPNERQWIITMFFLGLGVGSIVYGPLSDRFGRRPVLQVSLCLFIVATLLCALAKSFALLLAARAACGFFAAAIRVIAVSSVRDRYQGDRMARVMSLIFMVFMIVPVLAPSFGQLVLYIAQWRWIFGALIVLSTILLAWVTLRLPETLAPENRVDIRLSAIGSTFLSIVRHRQSMGYMLATGVVMATLVAFLTSCQQIFFDVLHAPALFPFAFAGIAGFMAIGSFFNSRLVERMGARRLSQGALFAFITINLIHLALLNVGVETLASFCALQAAVMLCFAFTTSNFSAISMEPFAKGAGLAASIQASLTTIVSALLGSAVGARFDGTTLPMTQGFLAFGVAGLALVTWGERGRLFTRPHHAALREVNQS